MVNMGLERMMQDQTPKKGGFKPYGIRPPVIISLIVVSLVLAAVVEFLARRSQSQGGLSLVETADDLPSSTEFGYLYAPTIISVIYGLTWAWTDLDARRMQPWVELSRPGGATAGNSLLLDYPFGFLALVPLQAARHKHWPVFFAGTALVLIFWGITPLQSAVFGTKSVVLTKTIPALPSATLIPVKEQAVRLDSSILADSFAVSWLKQEFPAFTTADYAVLPVSPADDLEPSPKELWTVDTTKLTTELSCWPANTKIYPEYYPNLYATYDNGRGCFVNASLLTTHGHPEVLYFGWKGDARLDYYLEGPTCDSRAGNQFLAIWAEQTKDSGGTRNSTTYDFIASFCETSYHKQDISVKIARNESRPVDVVSIGPTRTLNSDEFNNTADDFLLNVGAPPVEKTRDLPASVTLNASPVLLEAGVSGFSTNMVIYALGLLGQPASALKDRTVLHEAFGAAHRALFSIAVPHLLAPIKEPELTQGLREYTMYGVVISRPISAVVEALLFLVAILASGLLIATLRSPSKLSSDPSTMGFTFKLVRASDRVLDRFIDQDSADDKILQQRLAGERYALVEDDSAPGGLKLDVLERTENSSPASSFRQHVSYLPVHPEFLRMVTGAIFISGIVGGMIVLVYLKIREHELNGLPRPSENFVVMQILENYIPMVFCTFLEPFLVLLARLVCLIQPFKDLQKGGSSAGETIEAKYISLPPQLLILQSIKSRHFMLAALSLLTILAHVLAVGLGGVFNENPVVVSYPAMFQHLRTTALTRNTILPPTNETVLIDYTHYYISFSNYSTNTSLPPWTAPDFGFLPISLTEKEFSKNDSVPTIRAQVRGFGAEPRCVPLSTDSSAGLPYADISGIEDQNITPRYFYQHPNSSIITCEGELSAGQNATGISGRQFTSFLHPRRSDGRLYGFPEDGGFCKEKFVMGWVRTDSANVKETMKSTFISCEAALKTSMFEVELSSDGRVLAYEIVGELEGAEKLLGSMAKELIRQGNELIGGTAQYFSVNHAWNNQSVATDWPNYILKAKLNSDELTDPTKPVPSHDFINPVVEELYRRLFALVISRHLDLFQETSADDPAFLVQGEYLVEETRIFLEDPAFYMSLVIMVLNIIVLVVVYHRERHPFLPRLPSTIGSQIAYVAASRMVRAYGDKDEGSCPGSTTWNSLLDRDSLDVGETETDSQSPEANHGIEIAQSGVAPQSPEKDKGVIITSVKTKLRAQKTKIMNKTTYSFGRYRGVDGNIHVGIEVDPLVTGIDKSMLLRRPSTFNSLLSREGKNSRTPTGLQAQAEEGGSSGLVSWFRTKVKRNE